MPFMRYMFIPFNKKNYVTFFSEIGLSVFARWKGYTLYAVFPAENLADDTENLNEINPTLNKTSELKNLKFPFEKKSLKKP